jgi:hypothetical protein
MEIFTLTEELGSYPGLRRRVSEVIVFPDYCDEELAWRAAVLAIEAV